MGSVAGLAGGRLATFATDMQEARAMLENMLEKLPASLVDERGGRLAELGDWVQERLSALGLQAG